MRDSLNKIIILLYFLLWLSLWARSKKYSWIRAWICSFKTFHRKFLQCLYFEYVFQFLLRPKQSSSTPITNWLMIR
jgi:hypothetical protein